MLPKPNATTDMAVSRQFSRRHAFLLIGQCTVVAGLALRMRHLQIVESEAFQKRAEANRISLRPIPPRRSDILDRNGVPLATERPAMSVFLTRDHAQDPEWALERFARVVALPRDKHEQVLAYMHENPTAQLIPLLEDTDWETTARLSANAPGLPGIEMESHWVRSYPYGGIFAHVVGYVAQIAPSDIESDPSLAALKFIPRIRVGKSGVERSTDSQLRGRPGARYVEVNATGRVIRELNRDRATNGTAVALTVDAGLQQFAHKRLGEEAGAAVVLDVSTGEIHCLLSTPSLDPNMFVRGVTQEEWAVASNHPLKPFLDRTLAGEYPPGSTFKIAVALAALESGIRTPHQTVFCTGRTRLGDHVFNCWKKGGHGRVDMHAALQQSCDTYFYHTGDAVGIGPIARMAHRLGLGVGHDIGISQPHAGVIPSEEWLRANSHHHWTRGDNFNTGIGQGFVLATPLQMAVMAARVANGAASITPRLILSPDGSPPAAPLEIDPGHLAVIQNALFAVCNEPGGTAYRTCKFPKGFAMAGKTGTSQVRSISAAERRRGLLKTHEQPREWREHGMFVGYAPVAAPRFAVSVVVEHGGSGSRSAAPVARDLLLHALTNDTVPARSGNSA